MPKLDKESTIRVMVAPGKSVDVDGVLNGPGSHITLAVSDAKSLHEKGFIVEPDDDDEAGNAGGDAAAPGPAGAQET